MTLTTKITLDDWQFSLVRSIVRNEIENLEKLRLQSSAIEKDIELLNNVLEQMPATVEFNNA